MFKILKSVGCAFLVIGCLNCPALYSAFAASHITSIPQGTGLFLSPAAEYETINAGHHETEYFTVADHTNNPMTINLSIEQFSVNNYSYTYSFSPPTNHWITFGLSQVSLNAGQSVSVPYVINVPSGSLPGGNYYSLVAGANLGTGNLNATAQAAMLLYLTVNGKLSYTNRLISSSIQRIMFESQISYNFSVIDTGNIYFYIYISGKLHGLTAQAGSSPVTHLVMPGKIRQFSGSIPHPILPGIYRATYGFTTSAGTGIQRSALIVYIPPWSIAAVLVLLLGLNLWYTRRKRKN